MRPLLYSINVTLDGCVHHNAVPTDEALDKLQVGSIVKICAEFDPGQKLSNVTPWYRALWARKVGAEAARGMDGERFWTIITEIRADGGEPTYIASIDNDLVYTQHHGLALGDTVIFQRRHILQIHGGC